MTTLELKKAAKENTWINLNSIIENSGMEINLIQNLPFCKMWEVKNNNEFYQISNTMKYCGQNMSDLKFAFY